MNSGYTALALTVVFTVGFVQTIRLGQHLHRRMTWVGTANYLWSAVVFAGWWAVSKGARCGIEELAFGTFIGAALVAGYFTLNACVRMIGAGITQTAERVSSVLIPTLAAMIFWDGKPDDVKIVGLVVALASFVAIGWGHSAKRNPAAPTGKIAALLVVLTLITGLIGVAFKAYAERAGEAPQPVFFFAMFSAATAVSLVPVLRGRQNPQAGDLLVGLLLGSANLITTVALYWAIARLPGVIVFPSNAAGVIILGTVVSALVWKERYSRWAMTGIVLAVMALALVNLSFGELKCLFFTK